MKKLLALTLTMAMLFTMTAMAEDTIKLNGETSKDVTATYKEGTDGGTIYSVDIVWGSMEFTYNAESKGVWNPDTHEYEKVSAASWTHAEGANVVKITNHSNAELTANVSFSSTVDGVSGTFDKNELRLVTAVGTDKDKAPNDSAYLTLSGELPKSEESVVVGSVTVTIDDIYIEDDANSNNNVDYDITSISANKTEVNGDNPLVINISGNNFDSTNVIDVLGNITLNYKNNDNYINTESNFLSYSVTSDKLITITIERDYFKNDFSLGIDLKIENIIYSNVDKTVIYDEPIMVAYSG